MYVRNDNDTRVASDDDGDAAATPAIDSATTPATDSATTPATGGGPATSGATTPAIDSATTPATDSATTPATSGGSREGMGVYESYRQRYGTRKKGGTMDPCLSRLDDYDKLYRMARDETRRLAYSSSNKLWGLSSLTGRGRDVFLKCYDDIARDTWPQCYKQFAPQRDSWCATTLSSLPRGEAPQLQACPEMNDCNYNPHRESLEFVLCERCLRTWTDQNWFEDSNVGRLMRSGDQGVDSMRDAFRGGGGPTCRRRGLSISETNAAILPECASASQPAADVPPANKRHSTSQQPADTLIDSDSRGIEYA